jgi:16S rRNA processing protein RimM
MLMEVITDFPERLQANVPVFLGQQHRAAVIESGRALSRGMLVKLRGIETSDAADALRGQQVFVTSEGRAPLQGGQYYHHQLLGSNVVDEHDVYVVEQAGGKELLLPAITSVILDVDVEQRLMRVRLPAVLGQDAHG